MFNLFDSAHDWLFLSLGCGFALITILMSWWSADHGLDAVVAARKHLNKKTAEATTLAQTLPALDGELRQGLCRSAETRVRNHHPGKVTHGVVSPGGFKATRSTATWRWCFPRLIFRRSLRRPIRLLFPGACWMAARRPNNEIAHLSHPASVDGLRVPRGARSYRRL